MRIRSSDTLHGYWRKRRQREGNQKGKVDRQSCGKGTSSTKSNQDPDFVNRQ
uniref:Uncharacterized protein n=1 Tax=Rhizophagus irregularis (strain DAOM 181602 / DAOM 197198 / MUCL 43194) TaxID=747089 RepID=U9UPU5_RHIID